MISPSWPTTIAIYSGRNVCPAFETFHLFQLLRLVQNPIDRLSFQAGLLHDGIGGNPFRTFRDKPQNPLGRGSFWSSLQYSTYPLTWSHGCNAFPVCLAINPSTIPGLSVRVIQSLSSMITAAGFPLCPPRRTMSHQEDEDGRRYSKDNFPFPPK
jgi:hypothetical protein